MNKKLKLKIAITGIWYPVAMCRYHWEALLSYPNIETWCAGPFTGRAIPWGKDMNLPQKYVLKPDHPLPMTQPPMVSYNMLEKHKPWEPDLWLEVNAGLQAIGKPVSAPLAVVATDPHVLDYTHARERADFFFNMQTPYMQPGDIWLPYAYSRRWHTKTEIPAKEREYAASLIGLQYPNRNKLFGELAARNFKLFYTLGLAYDDARKIYHNSVCGINWSSLQDTTARCYELMAFGIVPILNRVPDLLKMFKSGTDFLGFSTLNEAVDHVERANKDPDWANRIGEQARKAVEPHHYGARIEAILQEVGLI